MTWNSCEPTASLGWPINLFRLHYPGFPYTRIWTGHFITLCLCSLYEEYKSLLIQHAGGSPRAVAGYITLPYRI